MGWLTTEEKDKRKQYAVGCGMVFGVILAICSGGYGYMFSVSSVYRATATRDPVTGKINDMGYGVLVPLCIFGLFLGVCLSIGCLLYGILHDKNKNHGSRKQIQHARIIARFAIDRSGNLQADESQFEFLDGLRFYVRIMSPREGSLEYECSETVYYQCGEGMMGDAEIQGRWIGAFRPYTGGPVSHVGQPF